MSSVASSNSGTLPKWNLKTLEIRTWSVEKLLEPLVAQVTTLVNNKGLSNKKKGKSKRPKVLVKAVEDATQFFLERGVEIARENSELRTEMEEAIEDTRRDGEVMSKTSHAFAEDPCSSMKRGSMVRAARALLSSVTRLLILADLADVYNLLRHLKIVQKSVVAVKESTNPEELVKNFMAFGTDLAKLNHATMLRQNDLKDSRRRDELAAARADLKKNSMMLYTSSLATLQHPEVAAAKANRDFVFKRVQNALDKISNAVKAAGAPEPRPEEGVGELAYALDEFLERVNMDPLDFNEVKHRPSLEERLESIISGAALMADSSCTREDRRERIVAECNAVRQALQDLLQEYINNAGQRDKSQDLEEAIDHMTMKTKDLRRQLCKAVVDHISDSFQDPNFPILVLIEAAQRGDEKQVKEYAQVFREHVNKLVEVANLAASMSNNEEGVKMVKAAVKQIKKLCPQVINAALTLAARLTSKVVQDNMEVFKNSWLSQVQTLTDSVDEITSIENFLAVSEAHILEGVTSCVVALQQGNADMLDRKGGDIRDRTARICDVVINEMDTYEPDYYTEKVVEAFVTLREQVMPKFEARLETTVNALATSEDPQENEFIDSSRLVYDGMRDIRRAVLMLRNPEDVDDSDIEAVMDGEDTLSRLSGKTTDTDMTGTTDQAIMWKLPEAEKTVNLKNVKEFVEEKKLLDLEISKWDESSNDIIVLAKSMCVIMMDMTDFTRGRGRLKNTSDVIEAARRIADAGSRLDKLARAIAEVCPDSAVKQDLLAYLQRIALYCHQLNMCAKVKAEVQNISGEMIVSGLDSATSLIQAAKNLMNAVMLTVKSSYVASTKYRKEQHLSGILWKMKAPEKKPLVRREMGNDRKAPVRRASQKRLVNPAQALSEFKADI